MPADPAHEAPALVNDGVMFVSAPDNQIIAFDPKDGKEIWRYVYKLPEGLIPIHPTNRGVALWGDKVFFATLDAHLVALDAKTGKEVWNQTLADWQDGYYSTLAPLVVDGKVMIGTSGASSGSAASSMRSTPIPASCSGRPIPCRRPTSPAGTPGRATPGRRAAARSG